MVSTSLVCFRRVNSNFFVVNMSFLRVKYHFLGADVAVIELKIINIALLLDSFSYLCPHKKKIEENMRKKSNLHIVYNDLWEPLINRDFFAAAQAAVED